MSDSFREQPASNSPQIVSDLTCASEWKLSLREDRRQTLPFCSSVREGAISTAPDVLHAPYTPISVSQLSTQSFGANLPCVPHPFYANNATQAECCQFDGMGPRVERAESKTMSGIQIGINQEALLGHGSTCARNDPPQSHHSPAEESLGPLSLDILRDAESITPDVLEDTILRIKNWTVRDVIRSNRRRINGSMITCRWDGACTDNVKVEHIRAHLIFKHDARSNPKPYRCFWYRCSSRKTMSQLSSVARHIQEQHSSLDWQCPTCGESFTRDTTLMRHFDSCPGRTTAGGVTG